MGDPLPPGSGWPWPGYWAEQAAATVPNTPLYFQLNKLIDYRPAKKEHRRKKANAISFNLYFTLILSKAYK